MIFASVVKPEASKYGYLMLTASHILEEGQWESSPWNEDDDPRWWP